MPQRGFTIDAGDGSGSGSPQASLGDSPRPSLRSTSFMKDAGKIEKDKASVVRSSSFSRKPAVLTGDTEIEAKDGADAGFERPTLRSTSFTKKFAAVSTADQNIQVLRPVSPSTHSAPRGRSLLTRVLRICAAALVVLSLMLLVTFSEFNKSHDSTYSPNTEQDAAEMLTWVTACGGYISPKVEIKTISTTHGMMRGVFVKPSTSIKASETIFMIPDACLINSSKKKARMEQQQLARGLTSSGLTESDYMVLMLMIENRKKERSHYLPYLKILWPIQWESPDTWSYFKWWTMPAGMRAVAQSWLEHNMAKYDRIREYCARTPWVDADGEVPCGTFTKAEFFQATRWSSSRVFEIDTDDVNGDVEGSSLSSSSSSSSSRQHMVMVPVLDMLNHDGDLANVMYKFDAGGGQVIVAAAGALKPNTELMNKYFRRGTQCAEVQYLKYGFQNDGAIPCPEEGYHPRKGVRGRI